MKDQNNPLAVSEELMSSLAPDKRDILLRYLSGDMPHSHEVIELYDILTEIGLIENPKERVDDISRIALYEKHGLSVEVPLGRCRFSTSLMSAPHDDVPYCVDDHDHFFIEGSLKSLIHATRQREQIINRHHAKIKDIYDYCVNLNVGDIWVMCGGGAQLQAFFGNNTGYLGILYMDMQDENEVIDDGYLEIIGNKTYTFVVNWSHNNPLFMGKFKIKGIELVKSGR